MKQFDYYKFSDDLTEQHYMMTIFISEGTTAKQMLNSCGIDDKIIGIEATGTVGGFGLYYKDTGKAFGCFVDCEFMEAILPLGWEPILPLGWRVV